MTQDRLEVLRAADAFATMKGLSEILLRAAKVLEEGPWDKLVEWGDVKALGKMEKELRESLSLVLMLRNVPLAKTPHPDRDR